MSIIEKAIEKLHVDQPDKPDGLSEEFSRTLDPESDSPAAAQSSASRQGQPVSPLSRQRKELLRENGTEQLLICHSTTSSHLAW